MTMLKGENMREKLEEHLRRVQIPQERMSAQAQVIQERKSEPNNGQPKEA